MNVAGLTPKIVHFPILPLWLPISASGIAAIVLRRFARRRQKDHCQSCGYNLTGNVSGICPECGTPIPEHVKAALREQAAAGAKEGACTRRSDEDAP